MGRFSLLRKSTLNAMLRDVGQLLVKRRWRLKHRQLRRCDASKRTEALLASAGNLPDAAQVAVRMIAMDFVCVEALRVDTVIGAYPWERELRQPLLLSLRLGFDNRAVTALSTAIDYASVVQTLREHVAARTDQLLETLAESCCTLLAERFRPRSIELRIDKPMAAAALGCASVGISVHRTYA